MYQMYRQSRFQNISWHESSSHDLGLHDMIILLTSSTEASVNEDRAAFWTDSSGSVNNLSSCGVTESTALRILVIFHRKNRYFIT